MVHVKTIVAYIVCTSTQRAHTLAEPIQSQLNWWNEIQTNMRFIALFETPNYGYRVLSVTQQSNNNNNK